ncbi:FmdB family zinc ribbon protein [Intestinicryptomonas porci]|uniref:Zinc ribbon domain-containing protein n=1 Tax=Intestinicryptomonas porci TaxID=2926320 RepID=A0ABU4WFF9_9BACT|nr:zinc ribbon domain-containing protein [Opitutales bacterium CLA-KB-P66]
MDLSIGLRAAGVNIFLPLAGLKIVYGFYSFFYMPIFEYKCKKCGKVFEVVLTSSKRKPKCPACNSSALEKLISVFSPVHSQKSKTPKCECSESRGECCGNCMCRS